jgi:phospho-N-acetylmuramoyl-pentapeptide-transferase
VTHVLGAGVLAAFLTVLCGGAFIKFLRERSLGQNIREEGPAGHRVKQGTPTMGGLLILTMAALAFLIFTERSALAFTVLGVTVACAAIGFVDDYAKIANKRSLGLAGRWKLALLVPISAVLGWVAHHEGLSTRLYVPLVDQHIDLGYGWYPLVFLVLAASTSAVNLTDGLDGLAAGTSAIAFLAYTALATIGWQLSRTVCADGVTTCLYEGPAGDSARLDLAVFAAAMLGCCIGFLWYNSFPAQVFMGDTGSLGLGGALGALAVLTKTELLLPIIGGVFVVEALSVIIQVISFRRYGRRIFLMAPIHHHFEMKAWSETTIIVRFWIIAALLAGSAFVLAYLRFDQYT